MDAASRRFLALGQCNGRYPLGGKAPQRQRREGLSSRMARKAQEPNCERSNKISTITQRFHLLGRPTYRFRCLFHPHEDALEVLTRRTMAGLTGRIVSLRLPSPRDLTPNCTGISCLFLLARATARMDAWSPRSPTRRTRSKEAEELSLRRLGFPGLLTPRRLLSLLSPRPVWGTRFRYR